MRLIIDKRQDEVSLTTYTAGIDHCGVGKNLTDAALMWASGARHLARNWEVFRVREGVQEQLDIAESDAFMTAINTCADVRESATLLLDTFTIREHIPPESKALAQHQEPPEPMASNT